jgi:hypothetical protein
MMKEEAISGAVDKPAASLARIPTAGDLGSSAANQRVGQGGMVGS